MLGEMAPRLATLRPNQSSYTGMQNQNGSFDNIGLVNTRDELRLAFAGPLEDGVGQSYSTHLHPSKRLGGCRCGSLESPSLVFAGAIRNESNRSPHGFPF
jgi:hypothetical protein